MKFFRSIVLILIPFLAGLSAWNTLSAIKDEPIELRTVHPAIPDKVTVHGKSIILDKGQNPFRVDDTGSYSSTINRKYAAGVPFGESLPLYLAAVQQGGAVYFQECVFCHGANLSSRGIFANAFNPVPISFTSLFKVLRPWYSDVFIRTAKGGLWLPLEGFPWASTMPPMEEHISTEDIWKVTLFIYWHTGTEPYWDD